ncbi:MAG: N-acetyltransferase [Rhodospirillales bacterium]|nr:MAG: N-acetyltransferase [Rhodospirillales bacterium]
MRILEASTAQLDHMVAVERAAFGGEAEAQLVRELLADPSARPWLSLLAWAEDRPVGHILFTAARVPDAGRPVSAAILAPLAVVPDAQGRGIGGRLIERGAELLSGSGVGLVCVFGDPRYYARFGFTAATPHRLALPFPVSPEEAWMVRAFGPGLLGAVHGTVVSADALNRPELWQA